MNGNKQDDLIDSDATVTKKQKILNHRETKNFLTPTKNNRQTNTYPLFVNQHNQPT